MSTIVKIPKRSESSLGRSFVATMSKEHPEVMVWKLKGDGRRDLPDYQCLYNGMSVFVEMKRPGEEPTTRQFSMLSALRLNNFEADWFSDPYFAAQWAWKKFNHEV